MSAAMKERIPVVAAFCVDDGLVLDVPGRKEDFWLFLGELVGWGRFSLRHNRKPGGVMTTGFELVEVRQETSSAPYPAACIANVLWRQKEAREDAELDDLVQALVDALGKETVS